jgi:hypothetical protein
MRDWDWTGWFVAVVDQDGHKVDEVYRLRMLSLSPPGRTG